MTSNSTPSCTSMSFKARRLGIFLAVWASVMAFSGCRNPFLPSSDVQIGSIDFPGIFLSPSEMSVFNTGSPNLNDYRVQVVFWILNKVGVNITSVNIYFTDIAGNPVTPYKDSGGKTMRLMTRMAPPTSNDPNGNTYGITLLALDRTVWDTLADPTLLPKYIYCTITFRGEDDNGYDVKLSAQFTIKGYGF